MGKLSSAFEKADTSAAYSYSMMNFVPLLGIQIKIANSCTRWYCEALWYFKGLSQDGNGRIFLKTSTPLSWIKIFRMNLISAGSILLDSTRIRQNDALPDSHRYGVGSGSLFLKHRKLYWTFQKTTSLGYTAAFRHFLLMLGGSVFPNIF
jgi:hypothetical protein